MTERAGLGPRPAAVLSPRARVLRLHRRLAAVFALIALLGVAAFGTVLVLSDTQSRGRELDGRLFAQASRAAALMYGEPAEPHAEAVADDSVGERPSRLVVFATRNPGVADADVADAELRVVLDTGRDDADALHALARRAIGDEEERGTRETVVVGDVPLRAVAMPWFSDSGRIAGAVVALDPRPVALESPLLAPVLAGGAALVLALAAAGWLITRRGLRPAIQSIDDREQFLATAAHELRTPLARLRAGAEALGAREAADREAVDRDGAGRAEFDRDAAVRELVTIADDAGRVIGNLLLAARVEQSEVPVRRDPLRLDQLAADAEHLDPNVVVEVSEPIKVLGDRDLLRHALTNLVENALRHGIGADGAPLVLVAALRRGDDAVLQVRDLGPGIPAGLPATRRFVTGGAAGSTGLGLALVAWIAERHGAELRLGANEVEGVGASVELVLPAHG